MIRLCVASQTPPLRPLPASSRRGLGSVWKMGRDYEPQVGGVVPMMRALIRVGTGSWIAPRTRWVAMGGQGFPPLIHTDEGYLVDTIPLPSERKELYSRFKESVWRSFHGPGFPEFVPEEYRAFVQYNWATADRLLQHLGSHDLFYINDFQLVLCGAMIGSAAPALLRWHIPLEFRGYPEPVRRFFLRLMEDYDGIVVSTRAALEELFRYGFHGRAFQVYPYVDPREHLAPSAATVARFRERFGLGGSRIVLSVSRLDPVKRQDLLVRAFAPVARAFPDARLVLAGGGSFSTQNLAAAAGPSKDSEWLSELRQLVRKEGLERSVVFTGLLSAEELAAAYAASEVFVHPAPWEGFGLVVIEAWLHRKPVIVSRGAGVAELVDDGANGISVPPGSVPHLTAAMRKMLADPSEAERMGGFGAMTAQRCDVRRASSRLKEIFERTIDHYQRSGLYPLPTGRDVSG